MLAQAHSTSIGCLHPAKQSERPTRFDTNRVVQALKEQPFEGHSTIHIAKKPRRLDDALRGPEGYTNTGSSGGCQIAR